MLLSLLPGAPQHGHKITLKYGVCALAGQQGYSMNDTIARPDVLNVRLKDINFKIFFEGQCI